MSDFALLSGSQIRQLAFVVPDAEKAARRHSEILGSGPFFLVPRYKVVVHRHRGRESSLDVTSAYGQWSDVQVEFIQMHDDAPSAYRDLFPGGGPGMHHVAVFCDSRSESVARLEQAGYPEALYAETAAGRGYSIIDTSKDLGHMVELYEGSMVAEFYRQVREASEGFDGSDPVRTFDFASAYQDRATN
ncbi:VOC family protein [Mycolicibacterium sp. P9-22]|uniref:VOC family protein n=1 Tax=Mycolicibacterium sp. P9-22 TaxID=2024613 RepID=UPI0018840F9E|nr:VOC family protein [Mycolicibacterium sp. P9-22]